MHKCNMIILATEKANVDDIIELLKPSTTSLFEIIKGTAVLKHILKKARKTKWWLHIDLFVKITVKRDILHLYL